MCIFRHGVRGVHFLYSTRPYGSLKILENISYSVRTNGENNIRRRTHFCSLTTLCFFGFEVVVEHLVIKYLFTPSIRFACLPVSTRVVKDQILDKPFVWLLFLLHSIIYETLTYTRSQSDRLVAVWGSFYFYVLTLWAFGLLVWEVYKSFCDTQNPCPN